MHPAQLLSEYPSAPPARPVTDGLVEVVVVDAPDAVSIVDSDRLAGLGLDEDGLFALGRDNLRRLEPVELTQQVQDGGMRLHIAEGESFYTATWALLLDELVDVPAHGALVGVPDRHTLVAHLIAGREVVDAVNGLLPVCARIFSESPGNLSPSLYWFRDSTLVRVSSIGEGGALQFVPPEGLVAVLNEIVG